MQLRELAHARTGDKGHISNISLIVFDDKHYQHVLRHVTAEVVHQHFREIALGSVTRYELPLISSLNFVMTHALGGGVTRSLALDAHGKSLGSALLSLEIPDPK